VNERTRCSAASPLRAGGQHGAAAGDRFPGKRPWPPGRRPRRAVRENVHPPPTGSCSAGRRSRRCPTWGNCCGRRGDRPLLSGRRCGGAGDRGGAGPVRALQPHDGSGVRGGSARSPPAFARRMPRSRDGDDRRTSGERENAPPGPDRGRPRVDRSRRLGGRADGGGAVGLHRRPAPEHSPSSRPDRPATSSRPSRSAPTGPKKAIGLLLP